MVTTVSAVPPLSPRAAALGAAGLVVLHVGVAAAMGAVGSGLMLVIAPALATLALFQAAQRSASAGRRVVWAWRVLGLALALATLGNLGWPLAALAPAGTAVIPPDVFFWLAYLLLPAGLLLLPAARILRVEGVRLFIDMGIVLTAGGCLLGVYIILPTLALSPTDPLAQVATLLYPVLDFVLFTALTSLLFRQSWSVGQWPVAALAAALAALILTDVAVAVLTLHGRYQAGGWVDAGWTVSYALIWLAGQLQEATPPAERRHARWTTYLPYFWIALLGGLLLWDRAEVLDHRLVEWGFVAVVGLVLVRQLLVVRENQQLFAAAQNEVAQRRRSEALIRDLNRDLEARVRERTAQLEIANQNLHASEARNRVLLQAVPDLIFILDRRGAYRDIYAPETSRLYAPPEMLLGRTLREALPPAVADVIEPALAAAGATGQLQTVEYPLPLGTGQAHFEARLMPYGPDTVLAIVRDITERRQAQAALLESERRFRETLENVELVALQLDRDGRATFCNECLVRLVGWPRAEVLGQLWFERFVPPESGLTEGFVRLIQTDAVPVSFENAILARSGETRLIAWTNTTLRDVDGRVTGIASLGEDITLRRRAEDQLRASLREKEVLLQEIHHRVKNNLQVISSLLSLQTRSVSDPAVLELLRDSQNRVRSMALVHEKLYRSSDLARIDLGEYARSLAGQLQRSYADAAGRVALRVEAADCWLDVDGAVPCGLIINELVSNALKHAFPEERAGQILVTVRPAGPGRLALRVADDGVGFPAGLDFRASPSLGLQLVNSLVDQLDGTLTLDRGGGAAFSIEFPASDARSSGLAEVNQ